MSLLGTFLPTVWINPGLSWMWRWRLFGKKNTLLHSRGATSHQFDSIQKNRLRRNFCCTLDPRQTKCLRRVCRCHEAAHEHAHEISICNLQRLRNFPNSRVSFFLFLIPIWFRVVLTVVFNLLSGWGPNMFTENDEVWRRHKRIVAPAFNPRT